MTRSLLAALAALAMLGAAACGSDSSVTGPTPPVTAVNHPGFDIAIYPGDAAMQAWKYPSSPYEWVGYYFPAPCHRDVTWSGKRATLASMGWGMAAIYVGQQDWTQIPSDVAPFGTSAGAFVTCSASLLSTAQGTAEAADAVAKMREDGFPDRSIVYLDVEYVATVTPALLSYLRGWIAGVLEDGHYRPGVYAAKSNATTLYDVAAELYRGSGATPPFWIASSVGFSMSKRPSDVGLSFAQLWQGMFEVSQQFNGVKLTIDVDIATTNSPSAP